MVDLMKGWVGVQGLEEELEEVRMKKEAVDAQVRLPHISPPSHRIHLIAYISSTHAQDPEPHERHWEGTQVSRACRSSGLLA